MTPVPISRVCSGAAQRDAVLAKQYLQFGLSSKLTRGGAHTALLLCGASASGEQQDPD